jgi:hypothetical protein
LRVKNASAPEAIVEFVALKSGPATGRFFHAALRDERDAAFVEMLDEGVEGKAEGILAVAFAEADAVAKIVDLVFAAGGFRTSAVGAVIDRFADYRFRTRGHLHVPLIKNGFSLTNAYDRQWFKMRSFSGATFHDCNGSMKRVRRL